MFLHTLFYCVLLCFYTVLLCFTVFTVFYCVLLCFTVFYCFQPAEQEEMDALVKALPSVESLKGFKMYPQDFEKVGPVVCYATVT